MPKVTYQSYTVENPEVFNCDHLLVDQDLSNLQAILQTYGAAIVPSLVSAEECEQTIGLSNQFYSRLTENIMIRKVR